MEGSCNKVYINPNFKQKSLVSAVSLPSKNNMHVNPYFTQAKLHGSLNENINLMKRKIFVNPNFITSNYALNTGTCISNMHIKPRYLTSHYNLNHLNTSCKQVTSHLAYEVDLNITAPLSVSKSRYALVRTADINFSNADVVMNKKSSTIKISKYKTARLSYIKNNFALKETNKLIDKSLHITQINKTITKQGEMLKNSYRTSSDKRKFIKINKHNIFAKKYTESKEIIFKKIARNTRKTLLNTNLKTVSGSFRKNNIPCPLFTKYGKCLRNIHGNCGFIHNKKHVSICRKFLKGICHDSLCRFSHEISAKKMPTCYFYLNGNCNKDNCPYLHVKLNNKVKLCKEFLNGYCEKGDYCTYRHVNKEMKTFIKRNMDLQRQYNCQSSAFIISKKIKVKSTPSKKLEIKKYPASKSELGHEEKSGSKCRYFRQSDKEEQATVCDVIKPSRCKLGVLPSFIKF